MMKYKFPLLISLGSLALVLTSCTAVSDPSSSPSSNPTSESTLSSATSSSAAGTSAPTAQSTAASETDQVTADQIIPTLSRPDTSEDQPPAEVTDPSIKQVSLRALARLSYAEEFAAVNDKGDLCLIAWANSGDGDGTATLSEAGLQCDEPAEVKTDGLSLRIEQTKDNPGVVLNMLPPDLTEDAVRTALLKIPGNHEDLRPPVEFGSTDFGLVSVAMLPETADGLGSISIPRPDGKDFTLDLD
ncbi:hypothetical protein [Glutamicibacter ardleyensis]|jgi:hypothetical protein|uniref:Secreted protein n=1 Tax=Glutamicibacter ardleyensis TaxID=225894 RepID=A0ABQ2DX75_9MICC|nr:hypothetical protein [Glutamicibacter ardleyensis]GGJ71408.1 hypothetical protein GCM10007173_32850 [Glutamicibacter ardleyensis]